MLTLHITLICISPRFSICERFSTVCENAPSRKQCRESTTIACRCYALRSRILELIALPSTWASDQQSRIRIQKQCGDVCRAWHFDINKIRKRACYKMKQTNSQDKTMIGSKTWLRKRMSLTSFRKIILIADRHFDRRRRAEGSRVIRCPSFMKDLL